MEHEILNRIERNQQEIHQEINKQAVLQAEFNAILAEHLKRINGVDIHHKPPCEPLKEHEEDHHRNRKLFILTASVALVGGGLIATVVFGILNLL